MLALKRSAMRLSTSRASRLEIELRYGAVFRDCLFIRRR